MVRKLFQNRFENLVFFAKTLNPFNVCFMAKPCQLTFGVVAHVEFGLFDRAFERA